MMRDRIYKFVYIDDSYIEGNIIGSIEIKLYIFEITMLAAVIYQSSDYLNRKLKFNGNHSWTV